jgi:hypothetical protein
VSRSRLPTAKAKVAGADIKNPSRYRGRPAVGGLPVLGDPYATMTAPQREAWEEFRVELPWLRRPHRQILRLACVLQARLDENPAMGVDALKAYSAILSKLGASPVDESRLNIDSDDDEDPAARFFQ